MTLLQRLIALFRPIPNPEPPAALPHDKMRLHLFAGDFADRGTAHDYCFHASENRPEQLTIDQPGAFINTAFVELVTGDIPARLADFLDPENAETVLHKLEGATTLIIITEQAFGGFPYTLNNTETLTYLGPQIVDV